MASSLGKRKRRAELDDSINEIQKDPPNSQDAEFQALLKKHFEAQFEPLPDSHQIPDSPDESILDLEDEESVSDWEGLSDDDDHPATETISHTLSPTALTAPTSVTKEEYKTFMTSKPPPTAETLSANPTKNAPRPDSDTTTTDALNLKNDLLLHRLLHESHLLSPSSSPSTPLSLAPAGKNRHRAYDLRLLRLGSKSSLFAQEKMPLAQRRGMAAKARAREEGRRKDALENGIVLEKAAGGKKKVLGMREKGIGAPAVGRFRGGTLKLRKKDVREIEGPKKRMLSGKGRERRGRR